MNCVYWKMEILKSEKVPFYCCSWSNIRSVRNAIRSGFRLSWTELTVYTGASLWILMYAAALVRA